MLGATHITQMFYHQGQLFILNDHNKLYAINGESGTIKWTVNLTKHRMVPDRANVYQDTLMFVFGQTLLQVRLSDGLIVENVEFVAEPCTTVDRTPDYFFFGATDSRFYSVRVKDRVPVWKSVCDALPTGRVSVNNQQVYFVTRDHTLYVSSTESRQLLWKARAVGPLTGVVVDQQQCFLPSEDTSLYCFDALRGNLQWKYLTGGPLVKLPVVTEELVFQPVRHKSLLCLNRTDGQRIWELKDGAGFLALNGDMTYVLTMDQHLTMMDNARGKRIASFYVKDMDLYAANQESNLIFLATRGGDILALQPNQTFIKATNN